MFDILGLMKFMPAELDRIGPTPTAVGKAFIRAGVVRGGMVKVGGKSKRLVAVRNLGWWYNHRQDKRAWAANYEGKMVVADGAAKTKRGEGR